MILGTQWYILFNVIVGTTALPRSCNGRRRTRRQAIVVVAAVILPAIFPAYVTGAVTAAGGSWNSGWTRWRRKVCSPVID